MITLVEVAEIRTEISGKVYAKLVLSENGEIFSVMFKFDQEPSEQDIDNALVDYIDAVNNQSEINSNLNLYLSSLPIIEAY